MVQYIKINDYNDQFVFPELFKELGATSVKVTPQSGYGHMVEIVSEAPLGDHRLRDLLYTIRVQAGYPCDFVMSRLSFQRDFLPLEGKLLQGFRKN